ncbi:hypothetical protein QFC19_001842 [Naganishia cerealis]|uniref:Uncharacterized protein n=1 Tax=Naganishia cerealis TaxID=610337 RepID=A0ACC2WEM4_9TREE|nr:hypothetical protein QFC19_001842 [Naganishia cerealis]
MPEIAISRSDASPEWWPEGWVDFVPGISHDDLKPEKIGQDHPRHKAFVAKIGSHLATLQKLPDPDSYVLAGFPEGYGLFLVKRRTETGPQAGKIKTEAQVFGSQFAHKFRTIQEFLPHAEWLMDTSRDIQDHSTCNCRKKPPSRPASQATSNPENGQETEAAGRKRKHGEIVDASSGSANRATEIPASEVDEESRQYAKEMMATDQDRKRDLREKRLYRKGELVWIRLPWKVSKPAEFHPDMDMGIEVLHVWPAIILSNDFRVRVAGRLQAISQWYDVKYCGPLDNRGAGHLPTSLFAHIDEAYIFPFSAFDYKRHLTIMEDALNVIAPTFLDGELGLTDTSTDWKARYTVNLPFNALRDHRLWDRSLAAFAQAVKFAYELADMWTQTDGYVGQQEDEDGVRTYFLGMWWGAERIWQEELVRLNKSRSQLELKGLAPANPDSQNTAIFLKISTISVQETPFRERKTWETLVRGDLYELEADKENETKPLASGDGIIKNGTAAKKGREAAKPLAKPDALSTMPSPPPGYHFRKLNPDDTEVTCDIFDIAGRIYPGLDHAAWGMDVRTKADGADPNGTSSPDRIDSLAGKLPGKKSAVPPSTWIETRYKAIMVAQIATRKWLAGFFVN